LADALGLAVAFVVALQTEMLVLFGFNTELHWQFVPTAALFMSLDSLGVSVSWPIEVFLNGLVVGGAAACASGKALFAVLAVGPGIETSAG